MKKYILANNFGKGFITHEDQEQDGLSFKCVKNIVEINGEELTINNWVIRVGGTEITETEALDQIEIIERENISIKILGLEKELVELKDAQKILPTT